jgi:hypothetical protein
MKDLRSAPVCNEEPVRKEANLSEQNLPISPVERWVNSAHYGT